MHFLVFGGTGPSGIDFCRAALREQHKLTLYVRNPAKIPSDLSSNENLSVIQGQLDDKEALQNATSCGAEACISFMGPVLRAPFMAPVGPSLLTGYELLVPLLISNNIKRGLFLSTPSFSARDDGPSLFWAFSISLIWFLFNNAYNQVVGYSKFISSQSVDDFRWTLFRVPNLRSGSARPTKAVMIGHGDDSLSLERKALAEWVLKEVEEENWVGRAPLLLNA